MLYRNLYSIITNDLIIQWGKVEGEDVNHEVKGDVTFAVSYKNIACCVLATAMGAGDFVDITSTKKSEFSYLILDRDYRSGTIISKNFYWLSLGY